MVHIYRNNGYAIALDENSGSVHIIDDLVYDILSEMISGSGVTEEGFIQARRGQYPPEEIREAFSEIEELRSDGVLFSEDPYRSIIGRDIGRKPVIKALCLHIAHACNLSCRYCFAGEGQYHGPRSVMSAETGKRALDFLIENSGSRTNLEVDFFGGEPLLGFDAVREIVAYGREREKQTGKRFRFTLTTNGVLLNEEVMDFACREMGNVVLSIDGRKEIHDRMRPFSRGGGSYDLILPKFLELAERRNQTNYYVRGTFTHYNTDFAADVLHLADLGFKQISVEPVVAPPEADYAITEEDVPVICEQYDILAREIVRREKAGCGFNFFHFMIDLTGGPCVYKRLSGCGSGTEYLAVTPEGELYPCHQFVGTEGFSMGTIFDGVTRPEMQEAFSKCNVYSKKECSECFARFYCSGGCAANAYNFSGDINGNYAIGCALQKKRIECALMIKAALAG